MKKEKLQEALRQEEKKYSGKTYEELSRLEDNLCYEYGSGEEWYQVEVKIVERNEEFIQLLIAVDDGKLLRAIFPLSTSVVIYKKGKNSGDTHLFNLNYD